MHLSNTNSERKQYSEQFKYLNKNDIVIHLKQSLAEVIIVLNYYTNYIMPQYYPCNWAFKVLKEIFQVPIFRMGSNDSNVEDLHANI